jgi:chemotaxis family two-component system sensor kinase Cph1
MASPFVIALRSALQLVAAATPNEPGEAIVAKRVARELERALARLEDKEAVETDLIAIVCHDLKDPLASIMMGAGFLRKTIPADDGAARRVVEAIVRSTERMSQVVGDFHDLSKLDAGRLTIELRPWDTVAVLHAAASSFETKARDRGVHLELEVPETPLMALCDRVRLTQVISKLVANAIKFTNTGGRVVLRGDEQRSDRVRIAVSDSGRGISGDRLATIFDHTINARRTPRDGPGLGLAIAQGLVMLQDGKIDVESRVDHGSEFSFTLPRAAS